jgi:hypothetical protein
MPRSSGAPNAPTRSKKAGGGRGNGKRGGSSGRGRGGGNGETSGKSSGQKKKLTPVQYALLTAPAEITSPVLSLVHPALRHCWELHPENGMALIFDTISPVRKYNRDTPYRAGDQYPFAVYDPNPQEDPNVTENDSETEPLNPYEPIVVQ